MSNTRRGWWVLEATRALWKLPLAVGIALPCSPTWNRGGSGVVVSGPAASAHHGSTMAHPFPAITTSTSATDHIALHQHVWRWV